MAQHGRTGGGAGRPRPAGGGGVHERPRRGRRGDGGGGTAASGVTTGLTDDTIKFGFIGADFGALAEAGLAPDLGDQPNIVQSVVDQINEDGGIGGRQVEVRVTLVDGTAGAGGGPGRLPGDDAGLPAPSPSSSPPPSAATSPAAPRCSNRRSPSAPPASTTRCTRRPRAGCSPPGSDTSMSTTRQYQGWAQMLDAEGVLDGKTIGVVTAEQSPEFAGGRRGRRSCPTLEELGHEVAVNVDAPLPRGRHRLRPARGRRPADEGRRRRLRVHGRRQPRRPDLRAGGRATSTSTRSGPPTATRSPTPSSSSSSR